MSNRKKYWKGRAGGARGASDEALFELALRGAEDSERSLFDPRTDRKTLQLCRQVQRALMLALAGECGDDLLRDVSVDAVAPAGGAGGTGHLLVRVSVPAGASVMETLARLNSRSGQLRAIVASSICRKRVPMLSFVAVPSSAGGGHD